MCRVLSIGVLLVMGFGGSPALAQSTATMLGVVAGKITTTNGPSRQLQL